MNNKVLLIDDDNNVLLAYRRLLRRKFALVTADSGAEGITALMKHGPFAVIVSDFRMPGMNGVEFLSLARQIAPDTIRIMLSGQADLQVTIDAINEGKIYYFLAKPCPAERFIKTLAEAVEQYQLVTYERTKAKLDYVHKTIQGTVGTLASMVARRDSYTATHQERVSKLTTAIAREMGFPLERIELMAMAANIHDIGKIYVPAEILSKPGRITNLEKALTRTHSRVGYDILKTIECPARIDQIVYQHHERLDGSGYPLGLSGSEILIEARILSVADVVEAIASHRPYRPAFTIEEALNEIAQRSGVLYDTDVVNACIKVFQTGRFTL